MKHSEPKGGLSDLHGSVLAAAILDECNFRLAAIALLIIVVDVLACEILIAAGVSIELSQGSALFIAAILSVSLGAAGLLAESSWQGAMSRWTLSSAWLMLLLLTLLLRSSILLVFLDKWHWQPQSAIIVAVLLGDAIALAGVFLFAFAYSERSARRWPALAAGIVTYTFLLKLIFVGYLNLIPEEAYYWNYARHLDFGYLDHPPMVAWLIWLSTSIFGKSEFSIRLPAFLCWLAAAAFIFRLTLNLRDRSAAYRSALLLAVLPIYFGLGFFMTPDAPLFAAWAASLYFLERALIAQERRAWGWAGAFMGVGMLSKYPTALLGGATMIFLIIDRKSRHWLARPEPYLAATAALILFSPVLLWNMQNNWMSFAFQGTDRWSGGHHFSFHILLGSILLLLTPMGLLGIVRALLPSKTNGLWRWQSEAKKRQWLWAITFTLLPLSVFVLHSFFNTPKMNWTAPVWLAAIPLLASDMVSASVAGNGMWAKLNRYWMPTIVALIFLHTISFYYISVGLPGAGPMSPERLFGEWRELGRKVGEIRQMIEVKNGARPVVVGMDKNFISSELSFYDSVNDDETTGGAHLFGQRSLMWAVWFPPSAALGKDILMIDFDRKRIQSPKLTQYFDSLGDVSMESLQHNGRVVGNFYWRVGRAYHYSGNPYAPKRRQE